LVGSGSISCCACCTAFSTWYTVSIDKGESVFADDTLVKVWSKADFTGLMTVSTFVCTVSSHPLVTTVTRSISLVVCVFNTVLTFISTWS
jgi:hypothetical protein